MKQILTFVLLSFFVSVVYAKKPKTDNPRADIKVSYNWHGTSTKSDRSPYTYDYEYLLLANPRESKFYNLRNEYYDSLESTPSGRAKLNQMFDAGLQLYAEKHDRSGIPTNKGFMWVFKSFPKSETTMYDAYGLGEYGYYTEPHSEIEWQLGDSVKTILGYECTMAETDYHGRHWTVWFSSDIPLQDGPWKLCGLPGLILEATESEGMHSFTATGIEESNVEMFPIYLPKRYSRRKRLDMLRDYAEYKSKGSAIATMIINDNPSGTKYIDNAPEASAQETRTIDFLETDYH